jgi:hypothetical protein
MTRPLSAMATGGLPPSPAEEGQGLRQRHGHQEDVNSRHPGCQEACVRFASSSTGKALAMRTMAFTWSVILIGGIVYFSIIGLTHH